jgi:hypothetical protein
MYTKKEGLGKFAQMNLPIACALWKLELEEENWTALTMTMSGDQRRRTAIRRYNQGSSRKRSLVEIT